MSEETQKSKDKSKNRKKKLSISALAFADNIVFSRKEAWAYYRIQNHGYDYLSPEAQAELMQKLTNAFNGLMTDKGTAVDGHIVVTSVPIDVDLWQQQIEEVSHEWDHAPGFHGLLSLMGRYLENQDYTTKVVYLGINLGRRGALNMEKLNPFEAGIKASSETVKQWFNQALAIPDEKVSPQEEADFRDREDSINRILSIGHLKAERCTAEELLLLIKRQFYPAMPVPYLTVDHGERLGEGDILMECGSTIRNRFRFLEFTQVIDGEDFTGYRATLSMSRFPREMHYPGSAPFFYLVHKLGLPFTTYSRFTLRPTKEMKAELEKKKKEQRDELQNVAQGMDATDSAISGLPDDVSQAIQDQQQLSAILSDDKTCWVEGSYFIVVDSPTEEGIKSYVEAIKSRYTDVGITINWTTGDQADLFLAQMPGDSHRMKSFDQVTTLPMLSGSGFNLSAEVGDRVAGTDPRAFR